MAKILTAEALSDALISDFTWRVKEISNFKAGIKLASSSQRPALLRGGCPLVYAHWEGHLAYVTRSYTYYVLSKRLRYETLKSAFFLHAVGRQFDSMFGKRLSLIEKINFTDDIINKRKQRFNLTDGEMFKTRSNLNSEVLIELCQLTNLDISAFSPHFDFIDKLLVGRRNHIAHGQDISLTLDDFEDLSIKAISLMRLYRDLVDNEAQSDGFKV